MSSISATKKYRIVLFQDGLGDQGGFDDTRELMKESNSVFLKYSPRIDMSDYNPDDCHFYGNVDGIYTRSEEAENSFKNNISKLVQCAKEHPNCTILVSTYLCHGFSSIHNLDSIKNQRIKLIRIIDEIKKSSEIELDLIGHSQGGLVNLEAAIERNKNISKVVSISTPYAPVYLGKKLIFLNFVCSIKRQSAYEIFCENRELCDIYGQRVETLCSSEYYSDLKKKWNALLIRPSLTVITGTSGHLYKCVYDTYTKEPFDGLVRFSEQTAIENANFIHLASRDVPCYTDKSYAKSICFYLKGIHQTCTKQCTLGAINFTEAAIDTLFDLIDDAIDNGDIDNFENYDVVKAVIAGLNNYDINGIPSNYRRYYKIYADAYNHKNIRYNSETIGYLMALLVKN